jgi:hypothetical protein
MIHLTQISMKIHHASSIRPIKNTLFSDEKRKLKLVARVKKQITKFELTKEDLGFINS